MGEAVGVGQVCVSVCVRARVRVVYVYMCTRVVCAMKNPTLPARNRTGCILSSKKMHTQIHVYIYGHIHINTDAYTYPGTNLIRVHPFGTDVDLECDDPKHMQWLYETSLKRAQAHGIEGVTLKFTQVRI